MREDAQLPCSIEAERAVLGTVLLEGDLYPVVASIVRASDFFNENHRLVWQAIESMNGQGIDIVTVVNQMRDRGTLERVSASYVSGLADRIPDFANVARYASTVREKAGLRRIIAESQRLEAEAYGGAKISNLAADAAQLFSEFAATSGERKAVTLDGLARTTVADFEMRMASGRWMTGIPTGIVEVDQVTQGFEAVLSIIGARPSVGKTAFVLSMLMAGAAEGRPAVLYELDMAELMIGRRILAAESRVNLFKIRTGQFVSNPESDRVASAAARLSSLGEMLTVNTIARDIKHIAADIRRRAKDGLRVAVIDHIGLVRGGQGEKRYLQIGDISNTLVELAGETGVAIIALAQLNRDAQSKEPTLSELRESGNLEQDARCVLFLDRPGLRDETTPKCRLNVIVAKNSEGDSHLTVPVHYDLANQRITGSVDGSCKHCLTVGSPREEREIA